MKIGFFGDSFCADVESYQEYKTYISEIQQHYSAEIMNVGVGGSSIYDLLELQLTPFANENYLDVYVFVWTDPMRLFHRTVRNLNASSATASQTTDPILNAASDYYKYLCDPKMHHLQYVAMLKYADNEILSNIPETSKIIHLWSFGQLPSAAWQGQDFDFSEIEYDHTWSHGVEVRPSLATLTLSTHKMNELSTQKVPNHIQGSELNQKLANTIIDIIDNYNNYHQQGLIVNSCPAKLNQSK